MRVIEIIKINPKGTRCWCKIEGNGAVKIVKMRLEKAKELLALGDRSEIEKEKELVIAKMNVITWIDRMRYFFRRFRRYFKNN